ncbi:ATP-binding protein [Shewanella goraebulensis]|uniref:ATP-binding protein n=1 Tax=Shewanella goraebulensis TaxID=3050637 RepID=UPI002550C2DB|nr:ATP-binding protein [Shewanella goraebulensis]
MKISQKLFLAFIGLTSIVLVATLSLARWSFDQGFSNYIHSLEENRLTHLSKSLTTLYSQSDFNWNNVTSEQYERLLSFFIPDIAKIAKTDRKGPPPRAGFREGRIKPPPSASGDTRAGIAPHLRNPERRGPPRRNGPPTAIYTPDGVLLAGETFDSLEEKISIPVTYDGDVIAILYSNPRVEVDSQSAQAFFEQQLWTSLWIGLLCLMLASLISWVLARLLLLPVKEVIKSISHLSKGNYSERFNEKRLDELGQLMNDIDLLAMTLDKNRTAKNRWFADISHELRTPLSILCGEIDAIKAEIRPFNQVQLKSLEQEVMRIKHLVDDLYQLSLSDLGGLKYHFEPLNITVCITETLNSLIDKVSEKGLSINFINSEKVIVNGDKMRLQQLFTNVVLNAVAYTDSPGHIDIDLIEESASLLILVNDTKPSVPLDDCEVLFDPLHRQDSSRARRNNGAGLGLTISRNIVEAHSGSITARPSNLGGLCIEIILPIFKESH